MPEITIHEAERAFIDYTLTYGPDWSVTADRNQPVDRSDVTVVYFYVKTSLSAASPWISLSDASASQIEWLDEDAGQIRVKIPVSTEGQVQDGHEYELRIKWTDGTFTTADRGQLHVKNSIVDTP